MTFPRPRVTGALMLTAGLVLGWALAGVPAPALHATGSGDRSGESILAAGPILVRYNDGLKVQMTQDALYYLDYKTGRLLATVPSYRQSAGAAQYSTPSPSATWWPTSRSTWTTGPVPTS